MSSDRHTRHKCHNRCATSLCGTPSSISVTAHLPKASHGHSRTLHRFRIVHRCPTPSQLSTSYRSRHDGGPYPRTPRASDGRPVPAGLLACGSDAVSSLPEAWHRSGAVHQWLVGAGLPLTVAGAAAASGALITLTAFPLDPDRMLHPIREPTRAHYANSRRARCQHLAGQGQICRALCATARTSVSATRANWVLEQVRPRLNLKGRIGLL